MCQRSSGTEVWPRGINLDTLTPLERQVCLSSSMTETTSQALGIVDIRVMLVHSGLHIAFESRGKSCQIDLGIGHKPCT